VANPGAMKKLLVFPIPLLILFCSFLMFGCKKDNTSPYYISFSIDGSQQTYRSNVLCYLHSNDSLHYYDAEMFAENADTTKSIHLYVNTSSPLSTTINYLDTTSFTAQPVSIYFYTSIRNGIITYISSELPIPNNVNIHFTVITATYVQGTFSGDMAATINGPITQVNAGTFKLPIQ
jgi:hypothetical protein